MDIREEPSMQTILARMPPKVAESFSDTQLLHIKTAIGSRSWGRHKVDLRGTITFPFVRWRLYYVFLLGRNRRQLSNREHKISIFISALILLLLISGFTLSILLSIYLLKSYAGIDLFPGFSLGIWDYFKSNFMN